MAENSSCGICGNTSSRYSCPRCNISYCSVTCYQSEKHVQCSESFYQKWVQEELKSCSSDEEAKQRMIEILKQQNIEDDSDESLDSDDDEGVPDLAGRMADVNLDDDEAVWEKLTAEEKQEFNILIASGNILNILPEWEPWWKTKKRKTLIQDCEETEIDIKIFCPTILEEVPLLTTLTKSEPSPNVVFIIVNVLSSYAFTLRWLKGSHRDLPIEAMTTINTLSAPLRTNQVFTNVVEAFTNFEDDLMKCAWIKKEEYNKIIMQEDLIDIINGTNVDDPYFCMKAALSDINALCGEAVKQIKLTKTNHLKRFSGEPPTASHIQLISKKIIFYLSWITDRGDLLKSVIKSFS